MHRRAEELFEKAPSKEHLATLGEHEPRGSSAGQPGPGRGDRGDIPTGAGLPVLLVTVEPNELSTGSSYHNGTTRSP